MSFWKNSILNYDASIKEAIMNLEQTRTQIVLVVNEKNLFEGTLTDGDIRRAILEGIDLNSAIKNIMSSNPTVAYDPMEQTAALEIMNIKGINHIPYINSQREILGLYQRNLFSEKVLNRPNNMLIMAGGFGKRLYPHTENCPKPMLKISGKPILEHIIENAKKNGIYNFIISLHYMGNLIEDYFKDGSNLGVIIKYLKEDKPLGTAGAISLIDFPLNEPFVVTNGDVLTDIDYGDLIDFHIKNNGYATMAVRQHELQNPFGVVKTNGLEIIEIEEKPISISYINAGVYVFEPSIVNYFVKDERCDMPDLFKKMTSKNLKTLAYPIHEQWMDIGKPIDLDEANKAYEDKN